MFEQPTNSLQQSVLLDVIEHLPAGVFAKNADNDYSFVIWNAEMERIFANSRHDMLGRNDYDFFDTHEADYYRRIDAEVMAKGDVIDIAREEVSTAKGKILAHTVKVPVRLADGTQLLLGILEDITERESDRQKITHYQRHLEDLVSARTAELKKLATTDMLTGLANRVAFFQEIDARTANPSRHPFTLIYLDLDRFKTVNDTCGHDFGDQILTEFGRRLRTLQSNAVSISRIGGDEFAILVDADVNNPQIDAVCAAITSLFDDRFEVGLHSYTLDVSMGLSGYPVDARTPRQLVQNADMAMYAAKQGRHKQRWERYTNHLQTLLSHELEIDQGLRHALANGELYMVYQPQYAAHDRQMVGLEALIRWRSPELGQIAPSVFIPVAENTGLIHRLSDFVLDAVCQDIQRANQANVNIPRISINLSADELGDDTAERIHTVLHRYGLNGSALTIEITENAKIKITPGTFNHFKPLRAQGLRLSIDDFGTGYSSLAYLSQLDVDEIKIDQSFIQSACNNPRNHSIVQAILGIGEAFGYDIVAEGVETEEQANLLAKRPNIALQGYLLSAPVALNKLFALH